MKTSIVIDDITNAASVVGLELTDTEKNAVLEHLTKQVAGFAVIEEVNTEGIDINALCGGDE